jgi:hypothetical protein
MRQTVRICPFARHSELSALSTTAHEKTMMKMITAKSDGSLVDTCKRSLPARQTRNEMFFGLNAPACVAPFA